MLRLILGSILIERISKHIVYIIVIESRNWWQVLVFHKVLSICKLSLMLLLLRMRLVML